MEGGGRGGREEGRREERKNWSSALSRSTCCLTNSFWSDAVVHSSAASRSRTAPSSRALTGEFSRGDESSDKFWRSEARREVSGTQPASHTAFPSPAGLVAWRRGGWPALSQSERRPCLLHTAHVSTVSNSECALFRIMFTGSFGTLSVYSCVPPWYMCSMLSYYSRNLASFLGPGTGGASLVMLVVYLAVHLTWLTRRICVQTKMYI